MCNLYSVTKPQAAIRQLAKAMVDTSANLPSLPTVFPDQMAPSGDDPAERWRAGIADDALGVPQFIFSREAARYECPQHEQRMVAAAFEAPLPMLKSR